jgi:hypothetical protein
MRGVERARDLREDGDRTLDRQALAPEERAQVAAVDEAHRQVQAPLVLARLVDRDDVRVVERGGELRLLEERPPEYLVLSQLPSNQLERNRALEPQVGGPVHDAHPAAPDHRFDPIAGEDRAGSEGRLHAAVRSAAATATAYARTARVTLTLAPAARPAG